LPHLSWLHALNGNPWFGNLPSTLSQELLRLASPRYFSSGQYAFRRGDVSDCVFAIIHGTFHLLSSARRDDGVQPSLLFVHCDGDWFGETALFDPGPRTQYCMAARDSCVLRLPKDELEALISNEPALLRHFGQLLTVKTRASLSTVEDFATRPARARVAGRLLEAASGYGWRTECTKIQPGYRLGLRQADLAVMLGLTRQTTNRILSDMQSLGWLALRRAEIELIDAKAIRREAQGLVIQ
jgi:CRP-like cAMP-binding protein